ILSSVTDRAFLHERKGDSHGIPQNKHTDPGTFAQHCKIQGKHSNKQQTAGDEDSICTAAQKIEGLFIFF
ncbi:hypothetical protein KSZ74_22495, partial [Parabacteroides distasonis]|uniref:hypothetical protein n=1 Tax=Parabacteroides distasonis TaxID=823 RepID=UPI001C3911C5